MCDDEYCEGHESEDDEMDRFREIEDAADARHETPPRPNHFVHDSLGDPATCTGPHNHPERDAADARHETQFDSTTRRVEPRANFVLPSVDTAVAFLRNWVQGASLVGAVPYVLALLNEREKFGNAINNLAAMTDEPDVGLTYVEGAKRFECRPAEATFREFASTGMTVLELRVLAAHLSTALDTVHNELKGRQA